MKQYVFGMALMSLICFSSAFKEEDCEGMWHWTFVYEPAFHLTNFGFLFDFTVCVATIREFADTLTDDIKSDPKLIEDEFRNYCTTAKSKQQRLVSIWLLFVTQLIPLWNWNNEWRVLSMQCYYLGGLETSATGILGEMSKPLSWSMPPLKVCEKLRKKDAQVCDLRFGE